MSDAPLARTMNLSVAEGALATVMGTLLSGVFLTGFALQLGADRLQIGILAGLPVFVNLIQLAGAWLIERRGETKRLCVWTSLVSRMLWLPLLVIPFLPASGIRSWWLVAAVSLSCAIASLSGIAWLTWIRDIVPDAHRVPFLGRRNLFNTGLSLAMSLAGAFVIDASQRWFTDPSHGFLAVFAVAILCGLAGLPLLNAIPAATRHPKSRTRSTGLFVAPLRDANFRTLIVFYGCWNLSVQMAQPFFAVFMLEKLGLSMGVVTLLATGSSLLGLLTNNFWAKLCARFGTKPVVMLATVADAVMTTGWLFVSPDAVAGLVLLHCGGLLNPPLAMGPNNLLLRLAPEQNAAPYLATFNALVGPLAGLAAVLGGAILSAWQGLVWDAGVIEIGSLKALFLISAVGRLLSVVLLSRLHEPSAEPVIFVLRSLRQRPELIAPAKALSGSERRNSAA